MDKKKLTRSLMKSTFHGRSGLFPVNLLNVLFAASTKQAMIAFDFPTRRRIQEE